MIRNFLTSVVLLTSVCLVCVAQDHPERPVAIEPDGTLTLARALELVLLQNPSLEAFSWDVRAAEARTLQAGLRPNPELSLELDEVRWEPGPEATTRTSRLNGAFELERRAERREHAGLSDAEITIQLSQVIELGGKRAKRKQLAQHETQVSTWDYEVAKAEVVR